MVSIHFSLKQTDKIVAIKEGWCNQKGYTEPHIYVTAQAKDDCLVIASIGQNMSIQSQWTYAALGTKWDLRTFNSNLMTVQTEWQGSDLKSCRSIICTQGHQCLPGICIIQYTSNSTSTLSWLNAEFCFWDELLQQNSPFNLLSGWVSTGYIKHRFVLYLVGTMVSCKEIVP